jgi:hypothetical protein
MLLEFDAGMLIDDNVDDDEIIDDDAIAEEAWVLAVELLAGIVVLEIAALDGAVELISPVLEHDPSAAVDDMMFALSLHIADRATADRVLLPNVKLYAAGKVIFSTPAIAGDVDRLYEGAIDWSSIVTFEVR